MQDPAIDSRQFRDIVGRFATGVTVITTKVEGLIHGMTANAFCSLSLDPLLLLVCIERTAHCHQQLSATDKFGVSILAENQEDVSNLFARSKEPSADFGGIEFLSGVTGVPLLPGCLATLECTKHTVFDGGDHDIFVGRVVHGELRQPDAKPLLYFGGHYGRIQGRSVD